MGYNKASGPQEPKDRGAQDEGLAGRRTGSVGKVAAVSEDAVSEEVMWYVCYVRGVGIAADRG